MSQQHPVAMTSWHTDNYPDTGGMPMTPFTITAGSYPEAERKMLELMKDVVEKIR
jgi:hypothetical protein